MGIVEILEQSTNTHFGIIKKIKEEDDEEDDEETKKEEDEEDRVYSNIVLGKEVLERLVKGLGKKLARNTEEDKKHVRDASVAVLKNIQNASEDRRNHVTINTLKRVKGIL